MSFSESTIAHLALKQLSGSLSAEEQAQLEAWQAASPQHRALFNRLLNMQELKNDLQTWIQVQEKAQAMEAPVPEDPVATLRTAHRVHFMRRWGWAAAVLLLAGAGTMTWFLTADRTSTATNTGSSHKTTPADILPGTSKALLTLADGTVITLDSAANGAIAQQGSASIVKLANGELRYDTKGQASGGVMINTLSTPPGGQYHLVLPDGSRIWLNAASSVSYPASFTGKDRTIRITGEAYLEVALNKASPFFVDVNGKTSVQVLGTSFNINSYEEEGTIRTTLLEGSVRVIPAATTTAPGAGGNGTALLLKPGQQAQVARQTLAVSIADNVDVNQTIAWKNGLFNFNHADLSTMMRELSRWYNIKVLYEGVLPATSIEGKLKRDVKLSVVLQWLSDMGIKSRLDDRTLTLSAG
ncbi:MAG: FecR domain-containing protein [Candidatus Pseudobacter hemicellulosilyticus]|uniref:FecR domain-containing protein n=1 Tax=Candidatus Pseudobacter hemicellulosilyticus TaxID=3121375 RepID=A0AAJ5WWH6_9BACT|nr:MAG: FecR domain-containing protein [Pseudobacter sp.]